jgi:hypothetical protein
MRDPSEDAARMSKSEATTNPEHSYYQGIQHTLQDKTDSRLVVRNAFQALQEHHYRVQALYQALEHAMQTGQDRDRIWHEYHEALKEHRHLLHHYLRALEEHHRQQGHR